MQIRPYKPGDEQGIFILDRAVELHPWNRRNDSNWYWKYQGKNPAGQSLIYVAENDGEIIAHFAALPIWYWLYTSVNPSMTNPSNNCPLPNLYPVLALLK